MFIPFPFLATQFRPLFLIRLPVTVLFFAVLPFLSSQFILLKENFLKFLVRLRHFHSPDFPMRCQVMPFMNWPHSIRFLFLEALLFLCSFTLAVLLPWNALFPVFSASGFAFKTQLQFNHLEILLHSCRKSSFLYSCGTLLYLCYRALKILFNIPIIWLATFVFSLLDCKLLEDKF